MRTCDNCGTEVPSNASFCPGCGRSARPAPSPEPDPLLGATVGGKYRVLELLVRGGMGCVYRARHLALDREVALKVLLRDLLADPTVIQRFHREARAASRLNHPNSVGILDFGEIEDGTMFMAMELVNGRTLADVVATQFPLGPRRVARIVSQVLSALTEAHALGILHCDLKTHNVMLESRHDEADVVKVVDFGIARLLESRDPRLTQTGMVCGTPGYMSPEQARGEPLDARSDLYSVGVILYELLTGKLPFTAPSPFGVVGKMLVERPTPPSQRRPDVEIPPALEALVLRALSLDREARPRTADAFRAELLACVSAEIPASPPTPRPMATVARQRQGPTPRPPGGPGATSLGASRMEPATSPAPAIAVRSLGRDLAGALPFLVGAAAGALALATLLVWSVPGRAGGWSLPPAPAARAAEDVARAPPPPASTPPVARVEDPPPAPQPEVGRPPPPERAATEPERAPPPRPVARRPPPLRVPASGPPGSLSLPPPSSGDGLLTIVAPRGTTVSVNGRVVTRGGGRELWLAEGQYRLRAVDRKGVEAETVIDVTRGRRSAWEVAPDR